MLFRSKDDKPEVKAPEVKEKNLKKPEEAPTPVKTHESGGSSKVNSEQISAYPIGGIKSDNVVVVNKQQKPLFTMNTNESIMMDAQSKTAHVIPNQRDTAVGPQKPDTQPAGIQEFTNAVQEIRDAFTSNKSMTPKEPAPPVFTETHGQALGAMNDLSSNWYLTPSVQRAAYRAGGIETGEPNNNFHYSHGNRT